MLAIDCETTGVDLYHSSLPFLVTTCDDEGNQTFWEWHVDPVTRQPKTPPEDLEAVRSLALPQTSVIGHNVKFDVGMLEAIGIKPWPWEITHDTMIAGHLLASNQPHDLTSMTLHYLGIDIEPLEKKLQAAVEEARRKVRSNLPEWRISKKNMPDAPSVKDKTWRADYWLPRAVCRYARSQVKNYREPVLTGRQRKVRHPWWWEFADKKHPWNTVLREYANADSECTVMLWKVLRREMERKDLWSVYLERMKLTRITYRMEQRGITLNRGRLDELKGRATGESAEHGARCVRIAASMGYDLKMPKSGNNQSIRDFCFGPLQLPVLATSEKTGEPTLDKNVLDAYESILEPNTKAAWFISSLKKKRLRDTSFTYLEGYERFWLPTEHDGYFVLHPNLRVTGTDTLRMSSSNPNAQNVSDKGDFSLRYGFGPLPGREWWRMDYENLELRIPGYESEEEMMIELFEKPDSPPYFGSYHLLNASIIYPDLFWPVAEKKGEFKRLYPEWYKTAKNFGFALQYQGGDETCDRAARRPGSKKKVKQRLPKMDALNTKYVSMADKFGYVETIPDRTVNPRRGYPIRCTMTEYNRVLPTVPLNYHIQSTAMWCTSKAMVRCEAYLDELTRRDPRGYFMVLQVHDELIFDFPKGGRDNLPKVQELKRLMELSGDDIGIPLRVSVSYHPHDWAKGEDL